MCHQPHSKSNSNTVELWFTTGHVPIPHVLKFKFLLFQNIAINPGLKNHRRSIVNSLLSSLDILGWYLLPPAYVVRGKVMFSLCFPVHGGRAPQSLVPCPFRGEGGGGVPQTRTGVKQDNQACCFQYFVQINQPILWRRWWRISKLVSVYQHITFITPIPEETQQLIFNSRSQL